MSIIVISVALIGTNKKLTNEVVIVLSSGILMRIMLSDAIWESYYAS
jgi:hypothetical protein